MIKQITRQLFSFLLLLCALSVTAQEPEPTVAGEASSEPAKDSANTSPAEPRATALEKFAETFDETQWLPVADEQMFSLYRPDSSGDAKGALLILHRGEQPPWWNLQIEYLRQELPDYGWATFLVILPTEEQSIPARPAEKPTAAVEKQDSTEGDDSSSADTTNTAAEGEDKEIFDSTTGELASTEEMNQSTEEKLPSKPILPLSQRNEQRLMAAMHFLHEKNQFNLALLSDSTSAPQAAEVLLKMAPSSDVKAIAAQIILNFRRDQPQSNSDVDAGLFDPMVPLLDAYIDQDKSNLASATERQRSARRQKYLTFQQVNIDSLQKEVLSKRIRGFLTKHAEGMETGK